MGGSPGVIYVIGLRLELSGTPRSHNQYPTCARHDLFAEMTIKHELDEFTTIRIYDFID